MRISSEWRRRLLRVFLISIVLCALAGLVGILELRLTRYDEAIVVTAALLAGASLLAFAGVFTVDRGQWAWVGIAGLIGTAITFSVTLVLLWISFRPPPIVGPLPGSHFRDVLEIGSGTSWTITVWLCYIGLLSVARLQRGLAWARRWTVVVSVLLVGVILYSAWTQPDYPQWRYIFQAIGVLSLLLACGTIAVPVFHHMSKMKQRECLRTTSVRVALTCPRCSTTQEVAIGGSRCNQCNLQITLEIEEEQCAKCGYLLYKLESGRCPECGTPFVNPVVPA